MSRNDLLGSWIGRSSPSSVSPRPQGWWTAVLLTVFVLAPSPSLGDLLIDDFSSGFGNWNSIPEGSGSCATCGVGNGPGAYHTVDWTNNAFAFDQLNAFGNLSPYGAIRVQARFVKQPGFVGTPQLFLKLVFELPDETTYTWYAPPVPLAATFQTFTFQFASLKLDAGDSDPIDLLHAKPRFIMFKDADQDGDDDLSGTGTLYFDEVTALNAVPDPYTLTPVVLTCPPDRDAVRGMWIYPSPHIDDPQYIQDVLRFCAHAGVNAMYCDATAIWASGTYGQQNRLRTFVAAAHASGIRMEALGDPKNWLTDFESVDNRLNEVLLFNRGTASTSDDFDAYHFDVEFWTLSQWKTGTTEERRVIAQNYLSNVLKHARTHLGSPPLMQIGVDFSTYLEEPAFDFDGSTQTILGHALDYADRVVVLSYLAPDEDPAGTILLETQGELTIAAGKSPPRTLQLAANIEPDSPTPETFGNDSPDPYTAMNCALTAFHTLLGPSPTPDALAGFAVWKYEGYSAAAAAGGPVLLLAFDDPNDRDRDATKYRHDGVLGSLTSLAADYCPINTTGRSLNFVGNNGVQEFYVPHHDALNLTHDMTGMAWIRPLGSHSEGDLGSCTEGTIFSKGGQMWFQVEQGNHWLEFQNEGSGVDIARSVMVSIPQNDWTHVAFVRTAAAGGWDIRFFVNGNPVATFGQTGHLTHAPLCNTDPLMVGNYGFLNDPTGCEFNGDIDGIKIFPRALSPQEIRAEFRIQQCLVTVPGLPVAGLLLAGVVLAGCGGFALARRDARTRASTVR